MLPFLFRSAAPSETPFTNLLVKRPWLPPRSLSSTANWADAAAVHTAICGIVAAGGDGDGEGDGDAAGVEAAVPTTSMSRVPERCASRVARSSRLWITPTGPF